MKNFILVAALTTLSTLSIAQASPSGSCTIESAKAAATAWQTAFASESPEAVVDLYATDGILNPTLSNSIVSNQTDRTDYFVGLFDKLKNRTVEFTDTRFKQLGDVVVHSGHWTFRGMMNGAPAEIKARVSFVYAGKNCLIHDHHSSLLPIN